MNSKNFILFLFSVILSQVYSKAVNNECNINSLKNIDDIDVISKKLDISLCEAGNVFNFIIKGKKYFEKTMFINEKEKYNEKKCQSNCIKTNQKLKNEFKKYNSTLIYERAKNFLSNMDHMTICERHCKDLQLNIEVAQGNTNISEEEIKTPLTNLKKRDDLFECRDLSQANVSYVTTKSDGFKQYEDQGGVKTAITEVNGCGPRSNKIQTYFVQQLNYATEFEPACNSHDICFMCQKGKDNCNNYFKNNMYSICSKLYTIESGDSALKKIEKKIKKADCENQADLYHWVVSTFGDNTYTPSINYSTECAQCGVSIIQNTLYNTPFYVKK